MFEKLVLLLTEMSRGVVEQLGFEMPFVGSTRYRMCLAELVDWTVLLLANVMGPSDMIATSFCMFTVSPEKVSVQAGVIRTTVGADQPVSTAVRALLQLE